MDLEQPQHVITVNANVIAMAGKINKVNILETAKRKLMSPIKRYIRLHITYLIKCSWLYICGLIANITFCLVLMLLEDSFATYQEGHYKHVEIKSSLSTDKIHSMAERNFIRTKHALLQQEGNATN